MHVLCMPITLWTQPSGTQEVWPRNARVYALGVRDARPLSGGCLAQTNMIISDLFFWLLSHHNPLFLLVLIFPTVFGVNHYSPKPSKDKCMCDTGAKLIPFSAETLLL